VYLLLKLDDDNFVKIIFILRTRKGKSKKDAEVPTSASIEPRNSIEGTFVELQNLTEITNVKVGDKLGAGNFGMSYEMLINYNFYRRSLQR
jgi:hypothetical protein